LEVINTSHADYAKYSKNNIRFSARPACPYEDSITRFADLLGHEYEFFDYLFPITYRPTRYAVNERRKDMGMEKAFVAKTDRSTILLGCEHLGAPIEEHVAHLIQFFGKLG